MADTPADDSEHSARADKQRAPLSPALIATLVAVPVMVIVLFIVFAAVKFSNRPETESVPVESYSTEQGDGAQKCPDFLAALPEKLGDFGDKSVDGSTARWTKDGSGPVVVHCGVTRPDELAPNSSLQVIDPVQWFITDTDPERGQAYVSVDHRPYVAMWLPNGSGNAPITDVSALIAKKLDRAPLDFEK